jgi:predicted  nucleic acid-binding Zn-ribbon protein
MVATEVNLDEIRAKVQKLITLHSQLHEEVRQLEALNGKLSGKIDEQKSKIKELENQTKALKIAQAVTQGGGGDQNTRDLKMKINEYIREIDKCLAFLHK